MSPIHADPQQTQHAPLTQQEQQIVQQLAQQQVWDPAPAQTAQQHRAAHRGVMLQQQSADNQQLAAHAQAVLPQAQAQAAAPGAPVQALVPAERTAKQRREDERHAASARRHTPAGDAISYALHDQLTRHRQQQETAAADLAKHLGRQGGVPDALRGFLTLRDKRASSADKQRAAAADRALADGYLSGQPSAREAVLQSCVQQVLRLRLTADMLRPERLRRTLPTVLETQEKLSSLRRMMDDPANQDFFENQLPAQQHELLEQRLREAPLLDALLQTQLAAKGVNIDGSYQSDSDLIESARRRVGAREDALRDALAATDQILLGRLQALLDAAQQTLQDRADQLRRQPEYQSLGLTGYIDAQDAQQLTDVREAIARAPGQYAMHRALYDRLYQQFYRSLDALSDIEHEIAGAEQVLHQCDASSALGQLAEARLAALRRQAAPLRRQSDAAGGLIRFLLGQQQTLSEEGRLLAEREQVLDRVQAIEQAQQDEALWASNPDALIARVQGQLDRLQFSPNTAKSLHMTKKAFYFAGQNQRQFDEPACQDIVERIVARIEANPEYAPGMHDCLTIPDGRFINGLMINRLIAGLVEITYPNVNEQQIEETFGKLLCLSRYRSLADKQPRTPQEQADLDSYTPARLQALNATFQQGLRQLLSIQLTIMQQVQHKYGRFLTQLHPEDLYDRCGTELFCEGKLAQDFSQILRDRALVLDPAHHPEDQEYIYRADYYAGAFTVLQNFYSVDTRPDLPDVVPYPDLVQALFGPQAQYTIEALRSEDKIDGPGFNPAEMKAYREIVRRRYASTNPAMLIGRFSPQADDT